MNFFDATGESEDRIVWQKKHTFGMILARKELSEDEKPDIEGLKAFVENQCKEYGFYIEYKEVKEMDCGSYRKQVLVSRMPTAFGYAHQRQTLFLRENSMITLSITCMEKEESLYEELINEIQENIGVGGEAYE